MPFTEKEMDNIDAAAGWKVCVRASPAIDRQSLEKALAVYAAPGRSGSAVDIIVAAARKHLETLPKPVWRVTGRLPNGRPAANYDATSRKEALDFARDYLDQDVRYVTVEQVQS